MAANTYSLIASQTLATTATSITFSGIPSTYDDLVLRCSMRGDRAVVNGFDLSLKFNGDATTTLYSEISLYNNTMSSGVLTSTYTINAAFSGQKTIINNSTSLADTYTIMEMYFPKYNATGNKPFYITSIQENNVFTNSNVVHSTEACNYGGTSGISSFILSNTLANFTATSSFHLYGIKNS